MIRNDANKKIKPSYLDTVKSIINIYKVRVKLFLIFFFEKMYSSNIAKQIFLSKNQDIMLWLFKDQNMNKFLIKCSFSNISLTQTLLELL